MDAVSRIRVLARTLALKDVIADAIAAQQILLRPGPIRRDRYPDLKRRLSVRRFWRAEVRRLSALRSRANLSDSSAIVRSHPRYSTKIRGRDKVNPGS